MPTPPSILILGGTTQATRLAEALAGHETLAPVLSFAGRTSNVRRPPIPFRIGGFGGSDGLAAYLQDQAIRAVIDATHPFAANISANALTACEAAGVPLAVLSRPAWQPQPGDLWIDVENTSAAVTALGPTPRNVFLAIGRQEIAAFRQAPHRFLIRSVDAVSPEDLPRHAITIEARGPFSTEDERTLLRQHAIDVIVAKNSGGDATYGKIIAARELACPVVMIQRPRQQRSAHTLATVDDAVQWLQRTVAVHGLPP